MPVSLARRCRHNARQTHRAATAVVLRISRLAENILLIRATPLGDGWSTSLRPLVRDHPGTLLTGPCQLRSADSAGSLSISQGPVKTAPTLSHTGVTHPARQRRRPRREIDFGP